MSPVLFYITAKDADEAEMIGKKLLENKLAACVNIFPAVRSMYFWKGKIQSDNEAVIIGKTTQNLSEEIISEVKKIHSYECPCVIFTSIEKGNKDYIKWIGDSTKKNA